MTAVFATAAALAASAGERPSIRGTMTCHVLVSQEDGTPVGSLGADDLEALVGDKPVRIVSVAAPPLPLSVAVLFDVSSSVPLDDTEIAKTLLAAIEDPIANVQLRFGAFAGSTFIGPAIADARGVMDSLAAIFSISKREPSPVWDAIDAGIEALVDARGLRAVIVLSDGAASGNHRMLDDVAARAVREGVLVSAVGESREEVIRQEGDVGVRLRPGVLLQALTDVSGGDYVLDGPARPPPPRKPGATQAEYMKEVFANQRPESAALVAQLVSRLRSRHTLTIETAGDGRFHRLEVRAKKPGLVVRAPQRTFGAQ